MESTRRKTLSLVVVFTLLVLLAWVTPGRGGAAPGGHNSVAVFGDRLEPQASVDPDEFRRAIRAHRQRTEPLTVTNTGNAPLIFTAVAWLSGVPTEDDLLDPGQPDEPTYVWRDSNEPRGPEFDWVEISEIGTMLSLWEDDSEVVDLPFDFPFYRDTKTSIRICSDGYITFGTKGDAWSNKPIPTADEPNDLIAVYWDDLNPPKAPAGGGVFYYYDAASNRFIVEWCKVPRDYDNGQYTFQAILYPDGRIVCQYLNMEFSHHHYSGKGTIGIENATGTDGLEVLCDTRDYMTNNLAIEIKPQRGWLWNWPEQGELAPGESMDLDVTFDLEQVASGFLEGAIVFYTNDTRKPWTIVPVYIQVIPNSSPEITACAVNPDVGPVATEFQFVAAARDPDGHIADKWWDFGDGSEQVHGFVATRRYSREGEFLATFTAADNDGYETEASVTVTVREPPSASWKPGQFSFRLGCGQTTDDTLILTNAGTGALVFGGVKSERSSDWLSWAPGEGSVPPAGSVPITVTVDSRKLEPGLHNGNVVLATNDADYPLIIVPVTVTVPLPPVITEARAEPTIGEPPLKVVFEALVEPGATGILDIWWDFGDGTDPEHQARAEHIYTQIGEYEASVHAIDENGVEVEWKFDISVQWLPVLGVQPEKLDEIVQAGEEKQTILRVGNMGAGALDFEISASPSFAGSPEWMKYIASKPAKGDYASEPTGYAGAGAGGPDQFGYIWIDSNHAGGPQFDWFEIGAVGTRVPLDDESAFEVDLPFSFPFYGDPKTRVHICSNGYLAFDAAGSRWTNAPIPDRSDPGDLIAVFWDDLDPEAGSVYYYHDQEANRFIVELESVSGSTSPGEYTFQAILYPDGTIIFQYLEMTGELASATVGIENPTGTDGLQVVYNSPYIKDRLAIGFAPTGSILRVNPASGYVVPGGSQDVILTLGSPDAACGTYSLYLYVSANDPYRPFAAIPVMLKINAPPAVTITAPAGGDELHGECEIRWTATDPDDDNDDLLIDLAWTCNSSHWHELGCGLRNTGSLQWNTTQVGEAGETFRLRARAIDPSGAHHEFITDEFTIINNFPPRVEIIRPIAGQVLSGEATIEWKAVDPYDDLGELKITLDCKLSAGESWHAIAYEQPNTGKHIWDTSRLERGGKYRVRVTATDLEGESGEAISEEFTVVVLTRMVMAAPNPANDRVTFYYDIDTEGELLVYDVAGRLVHAATLPAAANFYEWDLTRGGRPVANGLYFYVVVTDTGERSEVGRLVIARQ